MNLFEIVLLDIILITFPLLFYLFYLAYSKNTNQEERDLFLNIALISSIYLTIRFKIDDSGLISLLLLNVPLLIAYLKKSRTSILCVSALIVFQYVTHLQWNVAFLILEYIIYYLLYYYLVKEHKRTGIFVHIFLVIKLAVFTLMLVLMHDNPASSHPLFKLIANGICFYLVTFFVILMFDKGREIIRLHMTLKELEQDNQIKMSLFKITHEIKNPIAVCKGYLDMFDVENLEHSRKYIPILKDEIARTLLLLQDFLCMTKVSVEKEIIDINLLLEDTLASYNLLLKSKGITLDTDLVDDEIYINGDYNRLTQVFVNIIKNSIEAMGDNGKLEVTSKLENHKIHITIKDNGSGISKENLKKISEPFFTTKQRGTGLGVSLSTEIIKAHDGKIQYFSELEKGTTVEIVLDVTKEDVR